MGWWDFSNIGFLCDEQDINNVRNLLECLNVDFSFYNGSETGPVNYLFWNVKVIIGNNDSELKPEEIYFIVNKVIKGVTIFYESENGSNTSDAYYRYEEIYDPNKRKKYIGVKDYCYGEDEVFGQNVFSIIKEECEQAANERGIPVEWSYGSPQGDCFRDLCYEILYAHGGLQGLGKRESIEEIPEVVISVERIANIIDSLVSHGYDDLATMVKDAFEGV